MVCSPRGSTSYDASQVSESDLVKLAIRLTPDSSGLMEHAWADEETLWGRPLGNDLFEISHAFLATVFQRHKVGARQWLRQPRVLANQSGSSRLGKA